MRDSEVQWTHSVLVQQELKECPSQQFGFFFLIWRTAVRTGEENAKEKWGRANRLIPSPTEGCEAVLGVTVLFRHRWHLEDAASFWSTHCNLTPSHPVFFFFCVHVCDLSCTWKCFVATHNTLHVGRKSVCVCVCVCVAAGSLLQWRQWQCSTSSDSCSSRHEMRSCGVKVMSLTHHTPALHCVLLYIYHLLVISMNVSGQCPDSHYYLPHWCFLTVWKECTHGKDSLKLKVSIRRAPQLRQSSFPGLLLRWSTGGRRLLNLFSWDALAEENCDIQRSSYGNTTDVSCFYVKPPEVSVALGLMWREQSQFSRQCRCSTMDVVMQS